MTIKTIQAREILASGGTPSVEVTIILEDGTQADASVSFGASAGSREAFVLFDEDVSRYGGKGMRKAVANIADVIAPKLIGFDAFDQRGVDALMKELDGTENKTSLGANAILAVSCAVCRAAATSKKIPLWKYLQSLQVTSYKLQVTDLPSPLMVMIEGGKHADDTTDLQEFCVGAWDRSKEINEQIEMTEEIYLALKKILKKENLSTNVGNEGAFAPNGIKTNTAPLEFLEAATSSAGYTMGKDVTIYVDAAATEFSPTQGNYELTLEGKKMTSEELLGYYKETFIRDSVGILEDFFSENDWEAWQKLTVLYPTKMIVADDLTVTNKKILQEAIEKKAANAILIKLNQIGTVTETLETCGLARENGWETIVSHRGGGETNDAFMVDLAVAVGSRFIKCGPTRGERVAKYNRLMRIAEEIS